VPLREATLWCQRFPEQFSALMVSVDLLVLMWWTLPTLGADFFGGVDDLASLLERYLMPLLAFPVVACVVQGTQYDAPSLEENMQQYIGAERLPGFSFEQVLNNETILGGALPVAGTFRMLCQVVCSDLLMQPAALKLLFLQAFDNMLMLEAVPSRLKITRVGQYEVEQIARYARTEPIESDYTMQAWRLAMTSVEVLCGAVLTFVLGAYVSPWA